MAHRKNKYVERKKKNLLEVVSGKKGRGRGRGRREEKRDSSGKSPEGACGCID